MSANKASMVGLFLVLEPGNHMFKVIEAARRRGLEVVVFHTGPIAPPNPYDEALPCISHFVQMSGWRNTQAAFQAILTWCADRPVRGTYAGYEITLRVEALLRQHYGLPGYEPDKLDFLLNKALVRTRLHQSALTQLHFIEERELRALTMWPFPGRPAFLKPVNGSGSAYVRECHSLADVQEHLAEWDARSRHIGQSYVADHLQGGCGLFLEEAASGELLSLEGYVFAGTYTPIGITDRTVLARDIAIEMGNTFPCPHPRLPEIVEKVRAIHQCLGITHGATHAEVIVPLPDGDIELVEMNLRFAGGDILILVDRAFDVRVEDALAELACGERPQLSLPLAPHRYVSGQDFLAPAHVQTLNSIEIPGADVFFKKVYYKPGSPLQSTNYQADHVAAFAVAADTYVGALARASAVRAATTINGRTMGDDPNNVVIHYAERWAQ